MNILITGVAGFIGFHLTKLLAEQGQKILGIDNMNSYYDPKLKQARLSELGLNEPFLSNSTISSFYPELEFILGDIAVTGFTDDIVLNFKPDLIIHLAAQAGVRYSLENPNVYIESNVKGFFNILESCRKHHVKKLIYASSSSVYGNNVEVPFREDHKTDSPVSLYAATKKSNELFAHAYAQLFGIKSVGLRFFTVYGPYGRPDMAYFSFVKNILEGKSIRVFNEGKLSRDFTYVSDIVHSISLLVGRFDNLRFSDNHKVLNIGNSKPVELNVFIKTIEKELNKKAITEEVGMQAGDVFHTYADVTALSDIIEYTPSTSLESGIHEFVKWYKMYYGD